MHITLSTQEEMGGGKSGSRERRGAGGGTERREGDAVTLNKFPNAAPMVFHKPLSHYGNFFRNSGTFLRFVPRNQNPYSRIGAQVQEWLA